MSRTHKCCQKQKLRRGLWSPDEDEKLLTYIVKHGPGNWSSIPEHAGIQRCGKSCRLRWINYLRPGLKRGPYSESEESHIIELHKVYGNRWSKIALHLPGRTDNEIKNLWNSRLRKIVEKKNSVRTAASLERGARLDQPSELSDLPCQMSNTISLACQSPLPIYIFQPQLAQSQHQRHALPLEHQNADPHQQSVSKSSAENKNWSERILNVTNGSIVHEQELCTNTIQDRGTGNLSMVCTGNNAMQNSNNELLQLQNAVSCIHAAGKGLARNAETDALQHETLLWIRYLFDDHSSDNSSSLQQIPYRHCCDLQLSSASDSAPSTLLEDSITIPSLLEHQDVTKLWFEDASTCL